MVFSIPSPAAKGPFSISSPVDFDCIADPKDPGQWITLDCPEWSAFAIIAIVPGNRDGQRNAQFIVDACNYAWAAGLVKDPP